MPSIATQDYIRIAPVVATTIEPDAFALAEIKRQIERGTIWDCIFNVSPDDGFYGRPIGVTATSVDCGDGEGSTMTIGVEDTITQYEGMGAVQKAIAESGVDIADLPVLGKSNPDNYLTEGSMVDGYLCDEDGNLVKVTASANTIAALERTTEKPEEGADFVKVAFDDLLKLIGLTIV